MCSNNCSIEALGAGVGSDAAAADVDEAEAEAEAAGEAAVAVDEPELAAWLPAMAAMAAGSNAGIF